MEQIIPPSVPREKGTEEDKAIWRKFLNITALIERHASSARTTSSTTRENHVRDNDASSASASSGKDVPPNPRLHPYNDAENLEPRFFLTDDIQEAMNALLEQGVEEIMPGQLLLGHFKFLFENGKLNNPDDVKAAYTRVLGLDDLGIVTPDPHRPAISQEFIYEITLNLIRSSDPFGCIARDFAVKQNKMLDEQRTLYRENMKQLQNQLKEKCDKDLADVTKAMNDVCLAKEQELRELKATHRKTIIALTAVEAKHTMLTIKSTTTNGVDGYAQLQNDFKDLQAKFKIKEHESELYEKQCIWLTDAFLITTRPESAC
jgi:hypothetical protein